jgi:hypothetical protein
MAGDWIVANRFYAPRDDAAPAATAPPLADQPPRLQEAGA